MVVHGEGRARHYFGAYIPTEIGLKSSQRDGFPSFIPLSADNQDILSYIDQPLVARKPVGYQRDFLDACQPNKT